MKVQLLTKDRFKEAVNLVLEAELDTVEEIEHHLEHFDAHYVALDKNRVIGVIGWYQDTMDYATEAMGNKFPGFESYWVGFFVIEKEYRNQGVGYTLLRKIESVLKEKNADKLWVVSVPETKTYYEKQGFNLVIEGKINHKPKFFLAKKLNS